MIVRLEGRSAAADAGTPGIGNTRDGAAGGTLANRLVEPQTMVAVGTLITERPPHRSRRALLTHRAYMRTQLSRGYFGGV